MATKKITTNTTFEKAKKLAEDSLKKKAITPITTKTATTTMSSAFDIAKKAAEASLGKKTAIPILPTTIQQNILASSTPFNTTSSMSTPAISPKVITGEKSKTAWQWLSKQLMKPVGSVAAETEAIGRAIGGVDTYIPGKAAWSVLSGKKETSFSDVWSRNAEGVGLSKETGAKIGFVLDLIEDPLNYIGGGLTKTGKLAEKVTSLTKAGKTIKVGSKLANKIEKLGLTAENLILKGTKAEQAVIGQRAILKIAGKPIIKGEKIYQALGKIGDVFKRSKAGIAIRETFTNKTGIAELDNLMDATKNASNYEKQNVINKAIEIQKSIKLMNPVEIKQVISAIEDPVAREAIKDKKIIDLADKIDNLFIEMKNTEKAKGILKTELENYFPHIKAETSLKERIGSFFNPKKYSAALGASKERTIKTLTAIDNPDLPQMTGVIDKIKSGALRELSEKELQVKGFSPYDIGNIFKSKDNTLWKAKDSTIQEINKAFGKEFFQSNPAIAYAQRGLASAKAVTAREFLDEVGEKFFVKSEQAPIRYIESTNPLFKGYRAEPEVVKAVDQYIKGIQPEELKVIVRAFDRVQNWWKAQALLSPSYHTRNTVSNFWNNWLAGVKNPVSYAKARFVQGDKNLDKVLMVTDAGESLTRGAIKEAALKNGVIGKGWYSSDIATALSDEIGGFWAKGKKLQALNPLNRENILLKTNRAVGSAIENNARLAHFIEMVQKGYSFEDAALSVKKYLFDYEALSTAEKTIFKRIFPFYTWTRKNIPLQIETLITQPAKYAAIPKIIDMVESGTAEPSTEKYLGDYIKNNIPVRVGKDEKGNTQYFLLGNWLPSAQMVDFLSQPIENIFSMASPSIKVPIEWWANKSTFFKNTVGENSQIEYYYKQPTEFIGIEMRKKTANLLRNIRILNDIDKFISTPTKEETENSLLIKVMNTIFGKATTYDVKKSKGFYDLDTQNKVTELKSSIKKAKKDNHPERAAKLIKELKKFIKERKKK